MLNSGSTGLAYQECLYVIFTGYQTACVRSESDQNTAKSDPVATHGHCSHVTMLKKGS